jgi:hypothetical protein
MALTSTVVVAAMSSSFILMQSLGYFDDTALRERLEKYEKPAKEYYASLAMAQQFVAACCKKARENHKKIVFESEHFKIYGVPEQSKPYEIDYLENLLGKHE